METLCEEQSDREIYVRKDIRFVFEQRMLELNFLPVPASLLRVFRSYFPPSGVCS